MRVFYVTLFGIVLASYAQLRGTSLAAAGVPNTGASALNAARGSQASFSTQPQARHGYEVVYAFKGGTDGGFPTASLLALNGAIYGTTEEGGAAGFGTVFELSASGTESVLYSFGGGTDGEYPVSSLVSMNGALYGTTEGGGTAGDGTVFELSASGQETVLHSFTGGTDGSNPVAGLVALNGELYGTTESGGAGNYGTVFEVSTTGQESVLHTFTGGAFGGNPSAALLALHGALFGTTFSGGMGGMGTVFRLTTSDKLTVMYSFPNNGTDGANPVASLIALNDNLYGTTYYGGANTYGAAFEVSLSGQERVLASDVDHPQGGLVAMNGELYGTTTYGGIAYYRRGCYEGCGSVFKVSTSGRESVLYDFKGNPDAMLPQSGLIAVNGTLYGTTELGGAPNLGTIFKITP
jgi:uncharacterized repeat protein (TIGR03803 family)